jgi:aspartate ammonia-lyase
MPGKVNPVIPEAVTQAALLAIAHDQAVTMAAAMGSLELNPFLPLLAHALLESLDLLEHACDLLRRLSVEGIEADEQACRRRVENATASATALLPAIGYERASALVEEAERTGRGLKDVVVASGVLSAEEFDRLTSAEAVCRLGFTPSRSQARG